MIDGLSPYPRRAELRIGPSHEYGRVVQPHSRELSPLWAADELQWRGNRAR